MSGGHLHIRMTPHPPSTSGGFHLAVFFLSLQNTETTGLHRHTWLHIGVQQNTSSVDLCQPILTPFSGRAVEPLLVTPILALGRPRCNAFSCHSFLKFVIPQLLIRLIRSWFCGPSEITLLSLEGKLRRLCLGRPEVEHSLFSSKS